MSKISCSVKLPGNLKMPYPPLFKVSRSLKESPPVERRHVRSRLGGGWTLLQHVRSHHRQDSGQISGGRIRKTESVDNFGVAFALLYERLDAFPRIHCQGWHFS